MNILLTDGDQYLSHSVGRLSYTLCQTVHGALTALGHAVEEAVIEEGYDKDAEVEKWLQIDVVIWQMSGWWMDEPRMAKKYIDEVFTADVGEDRLMANNDRHRVNPTEGYGTGGLLHGKKHMISSTWNAPIEALTREGDLFEGAGMDGVYLYFHEANEFLGTTRLPPFICNDVAKNPQVEQYLADYRTHSERVFDRGQEPQIRHERPTYRQ